MPAAVRFIYYLMLVYVQNISVNGEAICGISCDREVAIKFALFWCFETSICESCSLHYSHMGYTMSGSFLSVRRTRTEGRYI